MHCDSKVHEITDLFLLLEVVSDYVFDFGSYSESHLEFSGSCILPNYAICLNLARFCQLNPSVGLSAPPILSQVHRENQ